MQESIYGWYPSAAPTAAMSISGIEHRGDAKEVYTNLGSRPPQLKTYAEIKLLNDHYKANFLEEQLNANAKCKQTPAEAVNPPWSLHFVPESNKNKDENNSIKQVSRSKSAPVYRNVSKYRIVLNIPQPQLHNEFETVANNNEFQLICDQKEQQKQQKSDISTLNACADFSIILPVNVENQQQQLESNKEIQSQNPIKVPNRGKKPLVLECNRKRPKTTEHVRLVRNSTFSKINDNSLIRPHTSYVAKICKSNLNKQTPFSPEKAITFPHYELLQAKSLKPQQLTTNMADSSKHKVQLQPQQPQQQQQQQQEEQQQQQRHSQLNYSENNLASTELVKPYRKLVYLDKNWDGSHSAHVKHRESYYLIDGNWKEQLVNREKYLQKRPQYNVKIDVEKLKPDPPYPQCHYNAQETFFLNTMPCHKANFCIDPNFISENLCIKKMGLQSRLSQAETSQTEATVKTMPIKYRRDYAFVY